MPEFKKLSKEEVKALTAKPEKKPSERERIRQEYRQYMEQFQPGDWVEVNLKEGEKRLTIKNRLTKAAEELGYKLNFARTRGPIRFEVQKAV
jgi:hypothetical protein